MLASVSLVEEFLNYGMPAELTLGEICILTLLLKSGYEKRGSFSFVTDVIALGHANFNLLWCIIFVTFFRGKFFNVFQNVVDSFKFNSEFM